MGPETTCAEHWDSTAELLTWRTHQDYAIYKQISRDRTWASNKETQCTDTPLTAQVWGLSSLQLQWTKTPPWQVPTCDLLTQETWAEGRLENTEAPVPHWSLWTVATGRTSPGLPTPQTWQHSCQSRGLWRNNQLPLAFSHLSRCSVWRYSREDISDEFHRSLLQAAVSDGCPRG